MGLDPDKDVVYFARTDFRNSERLFGIKRKDRRQHFYIVGKTGTGKSALLNNMIVQDIANGEGLCVVDPHGELVEEVLEKIPEERLKDVIYFNPADDDYHIGFNVLELPDPRYKHLVASGLMGIFTKIWAGVWSARMEYIMNNAILALLDTPGSTLLGITRILVDKEYRSKVIANVKDPVVKAFWMNEYEQWKDQFRNEAIAPIQNKVGQFLSTAMVRNIVGQSKSTIDIFEMMNTGKIFLVNVSKGRIGEDNSALLGAMLITKIQLAAMERVRVPEDERVDFYLYVDEFQNFATDSFAGILSEARKYRLNLILAHQYIGQLVTDVSTKVRDAIFGNVGTMMMFRIGATDAEFLEKEYEPEFLPADMVNLPNRCIYLKMMVDGITSRPFSAATLAPFKVENGAVQVETIIENSRRRYARPRQTVEDEINKWSGMMPEVDEQGNPVLPPPRMGPDGVMRYSITCSSCGKTATVPFEPIPGKPVYCKECVAKIKTGELQPMRGVGGDGPSPPKKERYASDLANIGIEFSPETVAPARPANQPTSQTARGSGQGEDAMSRPHAQKPNSPEPREPRVHASPPRPPQSHHSSPVPPPVPPTRMVRQQEEHAPVAISLGALKAVEHARKERPEPTKIDIEALRKSISESLGNASSGKDDEDAV